VGWAQKWTFVGLKGTFVEIVSDPGVSVASLYQEHTQIQYLKEERNPNPTVLKNRQYPERPNPNPTSPKEPPVSRETSRINILKSQKSTIH
jgi:hypothetical protein